MKNDLHPKYYPNCKVTCVCGNTFLTGSTEPELKVELCSACHPFYTGKQKLVDTARRVEKFEAKIKAKDTVKDKKGKKVKRAARAAVRAKKEVIVRTKDIKKIAQVQLKKK
jgi:large subunit ribosomal protein L31